MELLPKDALNMIALNFSPPELMNFCLVNKNSSTVCKDQDFWRMKLKKDYPDVFNYFQRTNTGLKNPKNLYIRKFTEVHKMIEKYVDQNYKLLSLNERKNIEKLLHKI